MQTRPTPIEGALIIEPDVHGDDRGFFKETYSQERYDALGINGPFVQDNVSFSNNGVLRGMHYDARMAKLVQCLQGRIFDVIVDMREDSSSYRRWTGVELSAGNHVQLFIPPGVAHGFYVLSDTATVHYKQTALYDPAHERQLRWNDPEIGIDWPLEGQPKLSSRDGG